LCPSCSTLAQGGAAGVAPTALAVAILIAASSNNLLKARVCRRPSDGGERCGTSRFSGGAIAGLLTLGIL
jgi:hypothetical protein